MPDVAELLADYAKNGSEAAFQEVVRRYLDLVYSTALRLVNGDSHLAEDVTQRVFADLAKMASSFSANVMLGGWLHRHTCYLARNALRAELRRKAREQEAVLMNEHPSEGDLAALKPVIDEAVNELGATDRNAIVLRFFEQRDFRAVGEALGSSEEAARKRVNRALDKLRSVLKRRGVTLTAAGLAAGLSTAAAGSAPAALLGTVTSAALATAAGGGGTALFLLQVMSMTKLQAGIIAAVTLGLGVPLFLQHQTATTLRSENEQLRAEVARVEALESETARLSNQLAQARQAPSPVAGKDSSREMLRLRGEIGSLRKTADEAAAAVERASEAPLSGVTANPEMNQAIRSQQKMALGMVYKGLTARANLSAEKAEALNNLLADNVMTNIAHTTALLRAGKSVEEMNDVFARQEAETNEQVKKLLGDEGFASYQEYNRDLGSYLTAEQFKSMMLKGDNETKDAQAKKLHELMRQETQNVLAANGLEANYQTVPSLSFRNIASEAEGEKSIQLLDSIYERVQMGASAFLSPEEVEKFGEFRKLAVNNNRLALTLNRKLMAPPTK